MARADLEEIRRQIASLKRRGRISAEKGKFSLSRQGVPQFFKSNCRSVLAMSPEDGDHLSIDTDRSIERARGDNLTDDFEEQALIRPIVDHEQREGCGGVQGEISSVGRTRKSDYLVGDESGLKVEAMLFGGYDDNGFLTLKTILDEMCNLINEKGVVVVKIHAM